MIPHVGKQIATANSCLSSFHKFSRPNFINARLHSGSRFERAPLTGQHSTNISGNNGSSSFHKVGTLTLHTRQAFTPQCSTSTSQKTADRWEEGNIFGLLVGKPLQQLPVLDRYLLGELLVPLALGLAGFTFLALSIGTAYEVGIILRSGGAAWKALQQASSFVLLRMPFFVGLALPMAALMAPLLAFSQLNANNEITALQASGVGPRRLMQLAGCVFLAVGLLHLALAEGMAPRANRAASDLLTSARSSSKGSAVVRRRGPPVFLSQSGEGSTGKGASSRQLLYAQRGPGSLLQRLTVVEIESKADVVPVSEAEGGPLTIAREAGYQLRSVTSAQLATWDARRQTWLLRGGLEHSFEAVGIEKPALQPASGAEQGGISKREERRIQPTITLRTLKEFNSRAWQGLAGMSLEMVNLDMGRSTDDLTLQELHRMQRLLQASNNLRESRRLQVKVQQRLALPAACLVCGLLGSALGLRLPYSQRLVVFSLTLAVVFSYYALSVTGALLAQLGLLQPTLGAWLPNLVGASAVIAILAARPNRALLTSASFLPSS